MPSKNDRIASLENELLDVFDALAKEQRIVDAVHDEVRHYINGLWSGNEALRYIAAIVGAS